MTGKALIIWLVIELALICSGFAFISYLTNWKVVIALLILLAGNNMMLYRKLSK
jgi:hypothetical protein